jgi:TadE-like protein
MGTAGARRRDDRGALSASVAVLPAVLMLFFAVVQISLWFYGRSVATTAARHGVDAARVETGTLSDGIATTNQFLDQVGGIDGSSVMGHRTATEAEITVVADPITVLPFFGADISVTIDAPVERFVE